MPIRQRLLVLVAAVLCAGPAVPTAALAGGGATRAPARAPAARVAAKPVAKAPLRNRVRWSVNRMLGKGRSPFMSKLAPDSAAARDGLTHRAHGGVLIVPTLLGDIARIAQATGQTVVVEANGRRVTASPSSTRDELIIDYLGSEKVPRELATRPFAGALPMKFGGGESIVDTVAPAMLAEANRVQRPVTAKVNGRQVVVHPNDLPYYALVQIYGK